MSKKIYVFPGQGSQYIGMGKDFYETNTISKDIFRQVNDILGYKLDDIIFSGTEEDLRKTEIAQPAIYVSSYIIFKILESMGKIPDYVAGHSLGEYVALTVAGILSFEDAIRIVQKRGEFIKIASEENRGGMVAILGLESQEVVLKVEELTKLGYQAEVANYNSQIQTVISYKGDDTSCENIIKFFLDNKAKRAIRLNVSGPFHSSFMNKASDLLSSEIDKYVLNVPKIPVIFNYIASDTYELKNIKDNMVNQVNHSVRWVESMEFGVKNGVDFSLEIGPGKVLSGLNKKIDNNIKIYNIETTSDLTNNIINL